MKTRLCSVIGAVGFVFALWIQPAFAQQPQGPIRSGPPTGQASGSAASNQTPSPMPAQLPGVSAPAESQDAVISRLKSDFDLLRMLGIGSAIVAACAGLFWYGIRHKRLRSYDTTGGLIISVLLAPLLLYACIRILSTDSAACLSLALGAGSDSSAFFDACRAARESAANMFGFRTIWSLVFGQSVVNGVVAPIPSSLVKLLMYVSVIVMAPVLFLIGKVPVKKALY